MRKFEQPMEMSRPPVAIDDTSGEAQNWIEPKPTPSDQDDDSYENGTDEEKQKQTGGLFSENIGGIRREACGRCVHLMRYSWRNQSVTNFLFDACNVLEDGVEKGVCTQAAGDLVNLINMRKTTEACQFVGLCINMFGPPYVPARNRYPRPIRK